MDGDSALLALLLSRRNNLLALGNLDRSHHFDLMHSLDSDHVLFRSPYPHLDTSMGDRRLSVNFLTNRRFSIGLGGMSDHIPMGSFHDDLNQRIPKLDARPTREKTSQIGKQFYKKDRRISNLGHLSASFFDDHATLGRRDSVASTSSFAIAYKRDSDDASDMSDIGEEGGDYDNMRLLTAGPILECNFTSLAASELKEMLEALTESMLSSQKSQQAIHDWDKKMGLKRSHSKTMRLTMRSRKKLKTMMKKDTGLASISAKS